MIDLSSLDSYYVPVTNLADEPIYDVSDDEVFTESLYYKDALFSDEDQDQGFNTNCHSQVVVEDEYIGVKKKYMNYGLGKKDCHRQSHHKPPDRDRDREKGHTFADLVATRKRLTSGPKSTKLLEETGIILKLDHETYFTKLYLMQKQAFDMILSRGRIEKLTIGVCKVEVQIQDESNDCDVQQRESIKFALSSCGIGANKHAEKIEVLPSHDIVKLASMDKKSNGHMTLIGTSASGSFSLPFSDNFTNEEEKAMSSVSFGLGSVLCRVQKENTLTTSHEQLLSL